MEGPSRDPRLLAEAMSKVERSQFSWCLNNERIHALLCGWRSGGRIYLSGRGMDYASSWDMIEVVVLTQDKVAGSWPTEAYMDR